MYNGAQYRTRKQKTNKSALPFDVGVPIRRNSILIDELIALDSLRLHYSTNQLIHLHNRVATVHLRTAAPLQLR